MTQDQSTIANAFVNARKSGEALAEYPGARPTTLAEAYVIQDEAIALDGRAIAGWKVGRVPPQWVDQLGSNRLSGPIFADTLVWPELGDVTPMPAFDGGFAAVEAEFLLHVAAGFSGPVPNDDAGTLAILDDVRIGIEIASSPWAGINEDGPCVTVSDFGNNNGLILGATIENWRETDLCTISLTTSIDGAPVGEATAATMLDGPLGAVRFLLGNLIARGMDVSGGFWVSSGAVTGVHQINIGQQSTCDFGQYGKLVCRIIAAKPR